VAAAPATAAAPMQAMAVAVPFLPPNRVPLPTPFGQRNVSMMPPPLAMPIMPYGQFPPPRWDGPAPFQGAPSTPTGRGTGRGQGRGRGRAAPSKPAPNPFPEAEQDSELNWGRGGKIRWDVVKSMFTIAQSPALAEQKKHPPHGKLSYWWQKVYEELCLEHPSFLRTSLTVNDAGGKRLQCQRSKLKNRFYDATKIPSGGNEEKRAAAEKMTKMLKDNGVYELLHAEFSDPNIAEYSLPPLNHYTHSLSHCTAFTYVRLISFAGKTSRGGRAMRSQRSRRHSQTVARGPPGGATHQGGAREQQNRMCPEEAVEPTGGKRRSEGEKRQGQGACARQSSWTAYLACWTTEKGTEKSKSREQHV